MIRRLTAAAALLVAGCASDVDHVETAPPEPETITTTADPAPAPGEGAWQALPAHHDVEVEAWHRSTTTTTAPPPPPPPTPARPAPAPRPAPVAGDPFDALAQCESGGNPQAVSSGGTYYGAFQFLPSTWRAIGYPGLPTDHSYAVQKEAAQALQARAGWGQWPGCARQLGLL